MGPDASPMSKRGNLRTGGQILVDALRLNGVDTAFCVPGESYIATLDALYDARQAIRLVVCRQEGGAANMADAYGKLTGRPGICLVTRGPGVSNAAIGVHTAFQDSTPLILLVGQVGRDRSGREALQEVDVARMFGHTSKWASRIDDPARIPELISRAFHTATSGRPGPVVLALPEDMQRERCHAVDAGPYQPARAHPGAGDMARLRDMLAAAERPLLVVGGGGWDAQAGADMIAFAGTNELPATVSFRCQDYLDNTHPNYAGHLNIATDPKLGERVRQADLLLVVGARLGEATTGGYKLIEPPRPAQRLIHVHAGAEELGRVYRPDLPINAASGPFAAAARALAPVDDPPWAEWTKAARADYLASLEPPSTPGALQMGEVIAHMRRVLPADAIVANGAGNYTQWLHRFYQFRHYRTQLAPTSGAMGYAVPAAVAAKILHPDRTVVSFNGDGCFLMNGQELATAVQYQANVVFLVVNNAMYGTIRMHQEKSYPGRVWGTDLQNPDFAAYARAFGAHGEVVEETDEFAPAFERALAATTPALIELKLDPEALSPGTSLRQVREAALEAAKG